MNKLSYIYVSIVSVLVCLWGFFVMYPYMQESKSIEQQIFAADAQLHDFEQTINMIPEFIERRETLKKKKEFLNSNLYTKEEVINLFTKLQDKAAIQYLTVTEITPPINELLYLNSFIPDSSKPQFLNIGVKLSGNYLNFAKFIQGIESEPYFRGINACRVSGSRDYNSSQDLYIGFKALLGRIGDKS